MVAGGWWLVAGGWWLAAGGYWLLTAGCWLVTAVWWLLSALQTRINHYLVVLVCRRGVDGAVLRAAGAEPQAAI